MYRPPTGLFLGIVLNHYGPQSLDVPSKAIKPHAGGS